MTSCGAILDEVPGTPSPAVPLTRRLGCGRCAPGASSVPRPRWGRRVVARPAPPGGPAGPGGLLPCGLAREGPLGPPGVSGVWRSGFAGEKKNGPSSSATLVAAVDAPGGKAVETRRGFSWFRLYFRLTLPTIVLP